MASVILPLLVGCLFRIRCQHPRVQLRYLVSLVGGDVGRVSEESRMRVINQICVPVFVIPWVLAHQVSLEDSPAKNTLEWLPFPPPGDPDQGLTWSPHCGQILII